MPRPNGELKSARRIGAFGFESSFNSAASPMQRSYTAALAKLRVALAGTMAGTRPSSEIMRAVLEDQEKVRRPRLAS